jgi:hypothetical protein
MSILKSTWQKFVTLKIRAYKTRMLFKFAEDNGLTLCEIKTIAGTDYIVDIHGALHRIGRK